MVGRKETRAYESYRFRDRPSGGYCFYWSGKDGKERRYRISSDGVLRERYEQQKAETGRINSGLRTQIGYRGIIESGRRSIVEGRKALKIKIEAEKGHRTKSPIWTTIGEVQDSIRKYYPPDKVEALMCGENIKLESPYRGYAKSYPRQYEATIRRFGGLFKVMERVYPGLYKKICVYDRSGHIDLNHIKKELLDRHNSGQTICPSALRSSNNPKERELAADLRRLAKVDDELIKSSQVKKGLNNLVSHITGIHLLDIGISPSRRKTNAILTERLTEFLFSWASLLGLKVDNLDLSGEISSKYERVKLSDGGFSDIRIGNQAIDAKNGAAYFDRKEVEKIIEKYTPFLNLWETEEPIDKSLIIFHRNTSLVERFFPQIRQAGIEIMTYEYFHKTLKNLIKRMQKECNAELRTLKPRVNNLDYLCYLHEEVSLYPALLTRPGNQDRAMWSKDIINCLINKAHELRGENGFS